MLPDHIKVTHNPGGELQSFLASKNYSTVFLLTDENTHRHCYPIIQHELPYHHPITVKAGEEFKTIETCVEIWQQLTEAGADRHSVVIVLGGGVLGDMGGFCAATFKRGIDFILMPTTLLAQVDASIGGKLGIDFNFYKNQIGVFCEPTLTLVSSVFLETLPERELRSGFAEVIKHALISGKDNWKKLISVAFKKQNWLDVITSSVAFTYSVVQQDPKEKGLRKILNAGHTIGHAIESFMLKNNHSILHGEAVAAGLVCEAFIGYTKNKLQENELRKITEPIIQLFGKISFNDVDEKEIAALCVQDKKNLGNSILAVLPEGIGNAVWDQKISESEIENALAFYRNYQI